MPQGVYLVRGGSKSGVKRGNLVAIPFVPRSVSGQGRIHKWSEKGGIEEEFWWPHPFPQGVYPVRGGSISGVKRGD